MACDGNPVRDLSVPFLPVYFPPLQDPQNAGQASLQNWYFQQLLINELLGSRGTDLTLIAPLWLQKEWFPDLLRSLVEPPRMFH